MNDNLNEYEARVLGALVEKQITTPDYYPLTLNALVNACNQKNNRHPVVSYGEEVVRQALDGLREKKLAYVFHGAESRVAKYGHLFPKSYDLSPPEVAIMCVLLLRGPQTPGELRGRTANMHNFELLAEVETTLDGLTSRSPNPLALKLPRQPGTKESRYAHLLSGEVEIEVIEPRTISVSTAVGRAEQDRLSRMEEELQALRREVDELKEGFAAFRKQFE